MTTPRRLALAAASVMISVLCLAVAPANAKDDSIVGTWLTKGGKSRVEIDQCGDAFCGKIVWINPKAIASSADALDKNNPDPALRSRHLVGVEMLTGFKQTGSNAWSDGKLYDPENGKTVDATLKLNPAGELVVKGCVWFVCRSQAWTRVK